MWEEKGAGAGADFSRSEADVMQEMTIGERK
jgi:hypothetical protein